MPWELQKLLVLISGVHPHVVSFVDRYNRAEARATQHLRWAAITCAAGIALCLLLYPLQNLCILAAQCARRPISRTGLTKSFRQEH